MSKHPAVRIFTMDRLRQLFRVHKGEGLKVLHFAFLGALLQAGVAIGISTGDSLFISNVGASKLPILYMVMPIVMLGFVGFYSYLIARYPIQHVLYVSLALVMVGSTIFYDTLALNEGHKAFWLVYWVAKIFAGIWFIALYTVYWTFTDTYFDLQDAKRLYPVFAGGGATGAMIGGLLVHTITDHAAVDKLYLAWLIIVVLTFPVAIWLVRRWKRIETDDEPEEAGGVLQQIAGTVASLGRSNYVRMFLSILFIGVVLNTVVEYQYSQIFQFKGLSQYAGQFAQPRSEKEVAQIFGTWFFIVNFFNLIVNFFLFNRMVTRFGVGNMTLIGPIAYLLTFVVLLMNYGYSAGILGFIAYQGIITSIDWNNANFLFNAVPANFKAQVRTFAEGLLEPLATATAGGFLFLVEAKNWTPDKISGTALLVAGIYFVLALGVRSGYLVAIVSNLKQEWLDFSRSEESVLAGLGPEDHQLLLERGTCADCKSAHSAIRILWLNDRRGAVDCLLQVMSRSAENMALSVPLLELMLRDEDSEVIRQVLDWLDQTQVSLNSKILEELGDHGLVHAQDVTHLIVSSDPDDRAAAVVASWDSWTTQDRLTALETVNGLLQGSTEEVAAGIRALGRSKHERHAHFLQPYFSDADPRIRHEAQVAVNRLATPESTRLNAQLLLAIENGSTEEREICMDTLAKIGAADSIGPLLNLSELFSPYEKRKAELVIRGIGLKSVPAAVAVMRNNQYPYVARSIAARALAQLAFPQLEAISPAIIQAEIRRAYEYRYYYQVLSPAPSSARGKESISPTAAAGTGNVVLSRFYRDMQAIVLDFVLELLSVGGRLPDFELISASLRSENRRDRANAIETIEQGVERQIFKMLLPLIDTAREGDTTAVAFRQREGLTPLGPVQIAELALQSTTPLEAAAGAQALWDAEHGAAQEKLRVLLRSSTISLLRDTVVSLLSGVGGPLNPIERLRLLGDAPFLSLLHTHELDVIGRSAREINVVAGEMLFKSGDRPANIYIVIDGSVEAGGQRFERGSIVGLEVVLGRPVYALDTVSTGATVLCLPVAEILDAARTYSNIALTLLAEKMHVNAVDNDDDEEDDIVNIAEPEEAGGVRL